MLATEFQLFLIRKIVKYNVKMLLMYVCIVRFKTQACTQQKYITFTRPIVFP